MRYDDKIILEMNVNSALVNILTSAMEDSRYVKILTKGGFNSSELKVLSVGSNLVHVNKRGSSDVEMAFFIIEEIASVFIEDYLKQDFTTTPDFAANLLSKLE